MHSYAREKINVIKMPVKDQYNFVVQNEKDEYKFKILLISMNDQLDN